MNTNLAPETEIQQAWPATERGGPLTRFWHLPSLTVARFTLNGYLRSGWLWGELMFVLAFFPVFWTYPGTEDYFFSTGGVGLCLLALLGTAIMTHRAMSARVYLPLARLPSRAAITRGLVLATGVLRLPWYLLLLALALSFHRIIAPRPADIVIGSLGAVINCLVISTLVVTLSPPIATRLTRILFLAWLVLAFAPPPEVDWLATLFSLARLPLLPLSASIGLGTLPHTSLLDFWSLPVEALYIVGLTLVADFFLAHRNLILH
jgi:hypothetical protein